MPHVLPTPIKADLANAKSVPSTDDISLSVAFFKSINLALKSVLSDHIWAFARVLPPPDPSGHILKSLLVADAIAIAGIFISAISDAFFNWPIERARIFMVAVRFCCKAVLSCA